jgi:ribonuclease HII
VKAAPVEAREHVQARPTFRREAALWRDGFRLIAGVDEVGRGPLAGPVMAAAVILPARARFPWLAGVRDSKLLTAAQRERLAGYIWERALAVGLGLQTPERIDEVGIAVAGRLAMAQALAALNPAADYALIDAFTLAGVDLPHEGIIHGDALCLSIAAASIIAKVERDRMMLAYDDVYPVYGFRRHKGYPTPEHLRALSSDGPCPIHRRSFAPVRACLACEPVEAAL